MPNHKSAEKRVRQTTRRRLQNRLTIGAMRRAIVKARTAVDASEDSAASFVKEAIAKIDRAVTKGAIKRTTGSRYIARLARRKAEA